MVARSWASWQAPGGGHGGFAEGFAVVDFDGADQATGLADFAEDVADEIGGGCFAVGAGDAEDFYFTAGAIVKNLGEQAGGLSGTGDGDLRGFDVGAFGFHDDGDGATGDGVGDVAVAVDGVTLAGDEEVAGLDQARIIADPSDGALRHAG